MSYLISRSYKIGTNYFYGYDDAALLENNKSRLGPEWKYYNTPVEYRINTDGYRMNKDLDDVDFDNYIAFFGCSFTVGVGLNLEETFAYKISSRMKCDYVNAAKSGTSPTFVNLNLAKFLKNVPKLPKAIIINWPPIHRLCYWYKEHMVHLIPNNLEENVRKEAISYWKGIFEKTVMEESHVQNTFNHIKNVAELLCKCNGIPLFQMSTCPSIVPVENDNFFIQYPDINKIKLSDDTIVRDLKSVKAINTVLARDIQPLKSGDSYIAHPGTEHQDMVTDTFFKKHPEFDI